MAHVGTKSAAKARLSDMDTREVSPVDRPANGEPFVVAKSEAGMADENVGGKIVAPAASDGEGDGPVSASSAGGTGGALAMPSGMLQALLAGALGAKARLDQLVAQLQSATGDDAAEIPSEPLMTVADIANTLAETILPYVANDGMVGVEDAAKAVEVEAEKAKHAPPATAGTAAPGTAGAPESVTKVAKAILTWTQEYIDSLSDYCFLFVEPSTTHDTDWRTLPLTSRHFPVRDHAGRLSLPGVIDAIEQIRASTMPWLSDQKKNALLLRLAEERLYEAAIVVRREPVCPPETSAELASIAELVASICPAAPAPAPAPAPTPGVAPIAHAAPDFGAITQKAIANLRAVAVAKSAGAAGGGAWDEARVAKMGAACQTMKAAMDGVTSVMHEAPAAAEAEAAKAGVPAPAPPATTAAPVDLTEKVAELAKSVSALRAEIGKSDADKTALKQRIAKMEKATPPSSVIREEKVESAPKNGTPPLSANLNELIPEPTPNQANR